MTAGEPAADKVERFRSLHVPGTPLVMPNPWDQGSAKLLASIGFQALATTSGGFANTLGRLDGSVTRDEAIDHAAALVAAVDVPVSADLENGFADAPADVAETIGLAVDAGLAGCSIEDYTGRRDDPIYEFGLAVDRVRAAADAAGGRLVLTARAENFIHGRPDMADTIARLQAFQEAGADVLFAPRVVAVDDVRTLVGEVDRPVNVLALPGAPTVPELAEAGVARISIGSGFALVAYGAVVTAARELLDHGTLGWWAQAGPGRDATRVAFSSS
ncbi:MAG: isocitrate lyase/phosphoenolpyruvate mutase family protein [Actinobacteria bacterium]|nr:isocitrate lyase/phosphoenolpyruvate mutase family protein [Actinomycetota bacterium]